jgi:hypothetical protein
MSSRHGERVLPIFVDRGAPEARSKSEQFARQKRCHQNGIICMAAIAMIFWSYAGVVGPRAQPLQSLGSRCVIAAPENRTEPRPVDRKVSSSLLISGSKVRVLVRPPRSPAKRHLPGATGIAFDFPRLCRPRRGIVRSLPPRIGRRRQKRRPGLWPSQTVSRRNSRSRTETGSNVGRDWFES